jgi:hypothetical protein
MFRVLTVAREHGSGGADIARTMGERLGWRILDKALIEAIASVARVDPEPARRYDERIDSWLHRVSRRSLWRGAFEGVPASHGTEIFDCETMAALGRSLGSSGTADEETRARGIACVPLKLEARS